MYKVPKHIQELKNNIRRGGKSIGSQGSGAIELAYLRGIHQGYVEGYKDALDGKKPAYTDESEGGA